MQRRVLVLVLVALASSTFSLAQGEMERRIETPKEFERNHYLKQLDPKQLEDFERAFRGDRKTPETDVETKGNTLHPPVPTKDRIISLDPPGKIRHTSDAAPPKDGIISPVDRTDAIRRFRLSLAWDFSAARFTEKNLLSRLNRENPDIQRVKIECQPEDFVHRYVVYNGEPGPVIYEGNHVGELIGRLHDRLDRDGRAIVMEIKGFTEKEERAFTTEFSVQHALIGDGSFWTPSTAGKDVPEDYRSPAIKLERVIVTKDVSGGEHKGWWGNVMEFSLGIRELWVRVWFDKRSLNEEFLGTYLERLLPNRGLVGGSAEQLVERSRKQLKANHPELRDRQMRIDIRNEFGNTGLGELLIQSGPTG
jgi:hypothetical protein